MNLFMVLEIPQSSSLAYILSIFIIITITVSTFAFVIETIPDMVKQTDTCDLIEGITSVIFTVEYVLRMLAYSVVDKNLLKFVISPLNLLDLLAIIPYYLELIL